VPTMELPAIYMIESTFGENEYQSRDAGGSARRCVALGPLAEGGGDQLVVEQRTSGMSRGAVMSRRVNTSSQCLQRMTRGVTRHAITPAKCGSS
jgi:hypothetical protein